MCPTITKYVAICAAIFTLCSCSPGFKKARISKRADRFFEAGQYENAKVEYLNLLRRDPRNPKPFQRLGFIWSEEGVPLRAAPFLIRACELAPEDTGTRARLALTFIALNQPAEARKNGLTVIKKDPANADAIVALAETSQTEQQVTETEKILEASPHDTAAYHVAAATLKFHRRDEKGVEDELQQALRADPKSIRAHSALAQLYLNRNDRNRAKEELSKAAELSPVRSLERVKYARFTAETGAIEQGKAMLQKITSDAPDYLPAWRALAEIDSAQKKYEDALAALENVFSRDPDNPDARLVQAEIWLAKGDSAKAISVLENLDQKYPGNAMLKFRLAQAYNQNNNPAQAATLLEQALAINGDFIDAKIMLAQLNIRAGKLQEAANAMEELRGKHPDLPQAGILLASVYQALNRADNAADLLREEIKARPGSAGSHFLLGLILRRQNKNDEARQEFERANELGPDNWRGAEQLVELDLAEKRYDAAMERAQKQLERQPKAAAPHLLLARTYAAQADWTKAESELRKSIEADANFTPAYDALVSVYIAAGKVPEAISELQNRLAKNPNDPTKLLIAALLEQKINEPGKAAELYEKLLNIKPDFLPALNNLACIYAEQPNKLDRAYELAQKARTLQPKEATIADTLGWVTYKRGDYQQGLPLLREAATGLPDNPEIQYHLGMASYMMGQAEAARSAFQRALAAPTNFVGQEEAKRRLVALQNGNAPLPDAAVTQSSNPSRPSDDIIGLLRTADALQKKGDSKQAAVSYEQILKLNPKLPEPNVKLAELYAGPLHDNSKALEFAKKARELQPNDPQIAAVVGRVAFQLGNFSWAYSLLQESVRKNRDDVTVLRDLAFSAYACGRVSEARKAMEQVVNNDSGKADAAPANFLRMLDLEQPSPKSLAAEAEIDGALKTNPVDVPALMAKAAVDVQRGNSDAAAGTYTQVLQIYPEFAPAQKRLAKIYAASPDKLAAAYELAIKARKSLPTDPDLARTLARISVERKEFAYAIQLFEQSAGSAPLDPQDLYYLGVAQLQTKQTAQGRSTLDKALKAGLSGPLADDAKRRLAQ